MSFPSEILSPINPAVKINDDEHTDEEKDHNNNQLNESVASYSSCSSSDNSSDEVPAPSSSAAGILQERLNDSLRVDRLNLFYSPNVPINLNELDHRCRARHYYNNPIDEHIFLTDSFLPFVGMLMVNNLLYWLPQLDAGYETTYWFTLWGFQRIFLEALEQAFTRLPYPRIYNCANIKEWLADLHSQSKNIALTSYPWAEKAQLSPFAPNTYKPITEHYCIHHRRNIEGFIIGAQDGSSSQNVLGGWRWKQHFFSHLPQSCLNFIQDRLPGFKFNLPTVAVAGVLTNVGSHTNPSFRGFWSVSYDQVWLEHTLHFDFDFSDVVPEPDVVHSGFGFSAIDNTQFVLPYQSTGSSNPPTDHLQPGYMPIITPYNFHPGYYSNHPTPPISSSSSTYHLMPSDLMHQLTTLSARVDELTLQLSAKEEEAKLASDSLIRDTHIGLNTRCRYVLRRMETLELSVKKQINRVYDTLLNDKPEDDAAGD